MQVTFEPDKRIRIVLAAAIVVFIILSFIGQKMDWFLFVPTMLGLMCLTRSAWKMTVDEEGEIVFRSPFETTLQTLSCSDIKSIEHGRWSVFVTLRHANGSVVLPLPQNHEQLFRTIRAHNKSIRAISQAA